MSNFQSNADHHSKAKTLISFQSWQWWRHTGAVQSADQTRPFSSPAQESVLVSTWNLLCGLLVQQWPYRVLHSGVNGHRLYPRPDSGPTGPSVPWLFPGFPSEPCPTSPEQCHEFFLLDELQSLLMTLHKGTVGPKVEQRRWLKYLIKSSLVEFSTWKQAPLWGLILINDASLLRTCWNLIRVTSTDWYCKPVNNMKIRRGSCKEGRLI